MREYTMWLRLTGWVVVFMVPAVVLVGNWISDTMDPNHCDVGVVCVSVR